MYRLNVELEDDQAKFLSNLPHGLKRQLIIALINYAKRRKANGDSVMDIIKENNDERL